MTLGRTELRVEVDASDSGTVVHCHGDLDYTNVGTFLDVVEHETPDAGWRRVVIDFEDVEFIDSSAIGAVVKVQNQATTCGGHVEVRGASPRVRRRFELTNVDQFIDLRE